MSKKTKKPVNAKRSGNPQVRAEAQRRVSRPTTGLEKLLLIFTFTLGTAGIFALLSHLRPADGLLIVQISNALFSTSGGFLAILLLLLLTQNIGDSPRMSKQQYRKTVIYTVVLAIIIGFSLAAFSSNQSGQPEQKEEVPSDYVFGS